MLFFAHRAIVALYILLPAIAIVGALWQAWRTRRVTPVSGITLTFAAGFAIGLALSLVYAVGMRGRLIPVQVLKAGYFATGLLLVLKGFDALLRYGLARLAGLEPGRPAEPD